MLNLIAAPLNITVFAVEGNPVHLGIAVACTVMFVLNLSIRISER